MAKHRNPAYTEEFRKEAVRLASLPGRTAVSVAKELGISASRSGTGSASSHAYLINSLTP